MRLRMSASSASAVSTRSCCSLMTESISSLTILTRSRMLDSVRMCCLIWSTMRRSKRLALSRGVMHSPLPRLRREWQT